MRAPAFDVDYGVPVDAVCKQGSAGVFTREWSKATVAHDCKSGNFTIVMKK